MSMSNTTTRVMSGRTDLVIKQVLFYQGYTPNLVTSKKTNGANVLQRLYAKK